ncbi:TonB-dependent receptor, partial [Pseudomonas aeruginosa]|uniref:TonB-dependent receptor n=1 Tax=Pseudomonas aeruginosa TaxID=287 RepID=UPI002238B913
PDYTLVDARIGYDLGKLGLKGLDVSLNANNLLDKDYVASCYSHDRKRCEAGCDQRTNNPPHSCHSGLQSGRSAS